MIDMCYTTHLWIEYTSDEYTLYWYYVNMTTTLIHYMFYYILCYVLNIVHSKSSYSVIYVCFCIFVFCFFFLFCIICCLALCPCSLVLCPCFLVLCHCFLVVCPCFLCHCPCFLVLVMVLVCHWGLEQLHCHSWGHIVDYDGNRVLGLHYLFLSDFFLFTCSFFLLSLLLSLSIPILFYIWPIRMGWGSKWVHFCAGCA